MGNKFAESYNRKNLVKGYAKWFGVDLNCALTKLQLAGTTIQGSHKHNQAVTYEGVYEFH